MKWGIYNKETKPKTVIAVSQWEHCLSHLLNSWRQGSLPVDIVGIVSNHEVLKPLCDWYNIPFHFLPVSKETKAEQEQKILDVIDKTEADFLVLARYMQILSNDMCAKLDGSRR